MKENGEHSENGEIEVVNSPVTLHCLYNPRTHQILPQTLKMSYVVNVYYSCLWKRSHIFYKISM